MIEGVAVDDFELESDAASAGGTSGAFGESTPTAGS